MVIEGAFLRAEYGPNNSTVTKVKMEMTLNNEEIVKLQNALMNRRMDTIQMVINSSAVAVADPNDTPSTSTESW